MTISKGCKLLLSNTGKTLASTRNGLYSMQSLHLSDGGIVASLPEVASNRLQLDIGDLHVHGGGLLHSIWLEITARNLTIDDLGVLKADPYDARYFRVNF